MRRARCLALPIVLATLGACEARPGHEQAAAGRGAPIAGAPPVLLGLVGGRAGPESVAVEAVERGVQLAVEEQNARGGLRGRQVVLRVQDDQGRPEEVALLAARLAQEEQVLALVGEPSARRSLGLAAVADRHQVPLVTTACSDPRLTRDGDKVRPYVFRACPPDPAQGRAMADFARRTLRLDRVAVLREAGADASVGQADAFLSRFKELGGLVLDDQGYRGGDADFRRQLAAIRKKQPQALYVPGTLDDVVQVARQARELGLAVPLLGGDGLDSPRLSGLSRGALEGAYFTSHFAPDAPAGRAAGFVERYQARHGAPPDALAARGYDAARLVLEAMGRATDLSRRAIRDTLAATRGFGGVTGEITIGADHDAERAVALRRVQGERAVFVEASRP